jgi:hypothetical protein
VDGKLRLHNVMGIPFSYINLKIQAKMATQIQIGCNYHTTWQSDKSMRFVLVEIKGDKARLQTRKSKRDFWTNVSDLIFITSSINKQKAKDLQKRS